MKKFNAFSKHIFIVSAVLILILSTYISTAYGAEILEVDSSSEEVSPAVEVITDYEQRSIIFNDDIVPMHYEERVENGLVRAIRVISEEEYLRSISSSQKSGGIALFATPVGATQYYSASPANASIYRDSKVTITSNAPYNYSYLIDVIAPEGSYNILRDYNSGGSIHFEVHGLRPKTITYQIFVDYAGNNSYLRCTNKVSVNVMEKPGFVPTMSPASNISLAVNGTSQFSTNFFENMVAYGERLNYSDVNWTSSNTAVATVAKNTTGGLVTAKAVGTAVITAESRCGSYKLSRTVTVNPGPVSAVSGLRTTAQTVNSVTLAWNAATNATYYDVSYGSSVVTFTGTSGTVSGLAAGTEYAFAVRARNSLYTGTYSATLNVRTKYPAVATPENLHISSKGANSITIAWNPVVGATGYDVLLGENVINVSGTNYTATGLLPKTDYTFQVRAKNPDYTGIYSVALVVKTEKVPLTAPASINVVEKTHNTMILSWSAVEDALSYVINYGAGEITSDTTTAMITGLDSDTEYSVKIKSVDERGDSPFGTPVIIKTEPEPFIPLEGLSVISKTHTSIVLGWDSVQEATVYEVIYNGQLVSTNTNSITVTGLLPETEYLFKISGKDAGVTCVYGEISVQTKAATVGIPTDVVCTERTRNSISLTWNPVEEAESYIVSCGSESLITQNNSITIGGLTEDTEYSITVQTRSQFVTGSASQPVIVKTYPAPYAAVTGLKYTERTGNSISLEWSEAEGFENYEVKFGGTIISCQENEIVITGLSAGTKYDFMVRIYTEENVGEWSNPLTVFTLRGSSVLNAEIVINAQNTKTYDVVVAGNNLSLNETSIFTITYDTSVLELVNLASHVPGTHIGTGLIPNTDIQILSIGNGVIEFKFNHTVDEAHVWSGILTIAKFKALSTASTTIFFEQ